MGFIEFTNTSVTYPGGLVALRDVTLSIDEGEFVVVVGLSGAGKSTMLRAINGLVPVAGSVLVDGREVVGASQSELRAIRSDVGMIFQTFNLVNRSRVVNNALMGRLSKVPRWRSLLGLWPAEDKEIALQSLERVDIVEKAYVRASDLSGGQQQRVAVARALASTPEFVLADEPTVNPDPGNTQRVLTMLLDAAKVSGATLVTVTHDHELLGRFDRAVDVREFAR